MLTNDINMLRLINDDNEITQRNMSNALGISLGKVNYLLKELINKKYIKKIEKNKNNLTYEITDLGLEVVENNLNSVKNTKLNINKEKFYKINQAVILCSDKIEGISKSVEFLEIDNKTFITRIIDILHANGIENILLITGYKKELCEELSYKYAGVKCIHNSEYMRTGTMTSLALAKDYVKDDFILIEGNLVFESRIISKLLKSEERESIVITNESGSGDETFVEIRDGQVFKMSKDVHQFREINGEVVGISKISKKLFSLMLKEFEGNLNPYTNYEYTMLDVGRTYKIGYEKISDLVWGKVESMEQYRKIEKNIVPIMRRKEMRYKIEEIKQCVAGALCVKENMVTEVQPIGGMTNKNYRVKIESQDYIVRIPGAGTTQMINRREEMVNSKLASDIGIDAEILYFNEEKGTKVSRFIEGAETLSGALAKKKENMKLVAEVLRKLHDSDLNMSNSFNVFDKIEEYEELCKLYNGVLYKDYYDVKDKIVKLEDVLYENGMCIKPCHNDTVAENFVKDINGKIYLIDWEYSGLNDPMWDIAAHCIECDFSQEDEEAFLDVYFDGKVTKEDRIRILIYKICQDFVWSIWTIIKEAQGDDFGTYGIDRYNRGKENLEVLKEMLS